ncbi:polymorphic toxin type 15 domain-containing protein [Actinomyces wuliandei]|uniref:polymorphic toxin type 15 domain-containing protein n=1 Tax=Actinomyces wuliandei TaxID=2057743 RepID=UPI0013E360A1|nr:polymorphic toxin type 15 domain-containing protein [Actinomyces wuliandei]
MSLLSAQRLLEGIRAYRAQGRQPTSTSTRNDKKLFMDKVVGDLVHVHHLSREDARARTAEVDRALVVLHESDQVTYGPSQPATTTEGWPSLGHGVVSSSIGGQGRPVATVLEQAALAVPADQRAHVRLLLRAVLTASPALAQDLRHGQAHLEPRTSEQVSATSPRGPPWTPAHVAATIAAGHPPWHPPPARAQEPVLSATTRPGAGQPGPGQPTTSQPPQPGTTHTGATTPGPPHTGTTTPGPGHKTTREEVLANIKARVQQMSQDTRAQQPSQPRAAREAPTGTDLSRTARLREATHPPTTAARVPPAQPQADRPPQAGTTRTGPTTDRPSRTGQPPRPLTREEVLARITTQATQTTQQPPTPRQTPTRNRKHNRGLGR